MPIFDTHCHYNLEPFSQDWQTHWQKAQTEGVTHSTIVSVDIATSKVALELAEKESHFHPILGCHPGYYQELVEQTQEGTENLQKSVRENLLQLIEAEKKELLTLINSKVVAIGETGLDYFRLPEDENAQLIKELQQAAFRAHIQIAQEKKLPLVIHARDKSTEAYQDILQILGDTHFDGKFILHCVSGPSEYVQQAIQMGAYLGLAGNITYKNSEHLRELALFAPANRLLLETDAPFLPPIPFRGKPCEPWMIRDTAEYVKNELNLDIDQIYDNSFEIFNVS